MAASPWDQAEVALGTVRARAATALAGEEEVVLVLLVALVAARTLNVGNKPNRKCLASSGDQYDASALVALVARVAARTLAGGQVQLVAQMAVAMARMA